MSTQMDNMHRPDDAFREYLEGELLSELRRHRRFRRLRAAAVILVSVGIGASATLASAQVRGMSVKDSLIAAAQADAMLASLRLEVVRKERDEATKLVAVGARPATSLGEPQAQLQALELELQRLQLNIAEIEATALPPRDELNAPLVKNRDFVRDRLSLQMMFAQQRLSEAEQLLEESRRRVRTGVATELEALEHETTLLRRRSDLAVLAEKLRARREFLEKGTPVRDLALRVERVEVQFGVQIAQRELDNAQARLELLQQRQRVGVATELEVMRAQVDLKMLELELQKVVRRLQQLR